MLPDMFPAFLSQFAAGCFLIVSISALRASGRNYVRLMAAVCLALVLVAGAILLSEGGRPGGGGAMRWSALGGLSAAAMAAAAWLFVNAARGDDIGVSQRWLAAAGGAGAMSAAVALALQRDSLLLSDRIAPTWSVATTTVLGAALLGTVTSAMLLGHRYLTDTDMPIAPLRRLAKLHLAAVSLRAAWVAAMLVPVFASSYRPMGDVLWFWLMVCVRGGLGVVGVAVFAWMAWDCVKHRATQSATALFYLSMVLVFLGELAGQYLTRVAALPV
jgi:hypothetical protein